MSGPSGCADEIIENSCDSDSEISDPFSKIITAVTSDERVSGNSLYSGLKENTTRFPRMCKDHRVYEFQSDSDAASSHSDWAEDYQKTMDELNFSKGVDFRKLAGGLDYSLNQGEQEDVYSDVDLCDDKTDAVLKTGKTKKSGKSQMIGKGNDKCVQKQSSNAAYQKPDRYCIYCKCSVKGGKLKRHILRKHKGIPEVKDALSLPKALQNKFFDSKRWEGVYEYNLQQLAGHQDGELMRERMAKTEDKLRMCTGCNRFFSNHSFYKHSQKCSSLDTTPVKLCNINSKFMHKDPEFVNILSKFREGEVGDICRKDQLVQQVGYRRFCFRRFEKSKKDETKKAVMGEMREVARLFVQFRSLCAFSSSPAVTTEDMFKREHLSVLREAIEKMSEKPADQSEKHGLKLNLNALIQRTIKSLKGFYTESLQDHQYEELCKFQLAYNFRSHEMYSRARFKCISNSMDIARRPDSLPDEEDIRKLHTYISNEIESMVSPPESFILRKYAHLRDLIVARLTLYNGRRGEEGSRILIKEWEDALSGVWLPSEHVEVIEDTAEKYLVGKFKLVYIHGKGKKFVPVLVPLDMVKPIDVLLTHRKEHGIKDDNIFLFATRSSHCHCSGWHAVRSACRQAGVANKVNANKARHRLSTIYASLEMSQDDQRVFLEHMGHESAISRDNYQCPGGLKEVTVMGKMLSQLDNPNRYGKTRKRLRSDESDANTDNKTIPSDRGMKKPNIQVTDDSEEDSDLEPQIKRSRKKQQIYLHESESDEEDSDSDHRKKTSIKKKKRSYQEPDEPEKDSKFDPQMTRITWSADDTQKLRQYFSPFFSISCTQKNNVGSLPSKPKIAAFLKEHRPKCLKHLGDHEAYLKTRVKLFNERKTMRLNVKKRLKEISN